MTRNSALNEAYPEARVEIHPADAEMHGITNNMPVRVTSRRGEIVLRTTVIEKTTVGVVFIPWHFAEAAANLLANDARPQGEDPGIQGLRGAGVPGKGGGFAESGGEEGGD